MRAIVILSAILIALLALFSVQKASSVDAPKRASALEEASQKTAPSTETTVSVKGPPRLPPGPSLENEELPDGGILVRDPEEIAAHQKNVQSMDLRYLESSPAKDTPEAKQIESMLAVRGISRAAVPLCYNVAWNYHHTLKVTKSRVQAEMMVEVDKGDMVRHGYGEIDDAFWEEIIQIKPTVFFGQKNYNAPRRGEKLLTE